MNHHALEPWMLRADWRAGLPAWLYVDLAAWPPNLPLAPLPPIPLIGIATAPHPAAAATDLLVPTTAHAHRIGANIAANPATAAVLVQLLRALEGVPALHALTLESLTYAALQAAPEHLAWRAGAAHNGSPAPRPAPAPHPPGHLHLTRHADSLALTLHRPPLNPIDAPLRDALFDAFTLAALDPAIRRIRLTATGRAFSIGADLAEFATTPNPIDAHAIRARTLPAIPLLRRTCPFEVHVQGPCIGAGLELAAFADHLTAAPNAWFQLPELRMGLIPGFGGCVSLPPRIGRQRTAALILSARRLSAQAALSLGLIDAITPA